MGCKDCYISPAQAVMLGIAILPACTTATAHTFAFEFDLVMDLMAIFSNKQAEVSTGEKTYDTTVYIVWEHIAWSKHAVKSWLYVEHPVGWMLFAWHFFNHHLDTEKTTVNHYHAVAGENPTENQFTQRVNTQHYFVSPIGMFWGYTPAKPCLTARFNNSRVVCIISNMIIPIDMRFKVLLQWNSTSVYTSWTYSTYHLELALSTFMRHFISAYLQGCQPLLNFSILLRKWGPE